MGRYIGSGMVALVFASMAQADFYFLLPSAEPGGLLRLVFSDRPEVNSFTQVSDELRLKNSRGTILTQAGGPGWRTVATTEPGTLAATIEHGVVLRGQREAALVLFHPKYQSELRADTSATTVTPFELEAVRRGNGIAFVVKRMGQPLALVDVLVSVPGEKRARVFRTDSQGTTATIETEGLYGARVYQNEKKPGDHHGRAYQEVRHYATLTVDFRRAD